MDNFDWGTDRNIESNYVKDEGEWAFVREGNGWRPKLLPIAPMFSDERTKQMEERDQNLMDMLRYLDEQWKESDLNHSNEGILRNHPRYRDLYFKWAIRYMRNKGYDKRKHGEQFEESEGAFIDKRGRFTGYWLNNVTANGREWIDEMIWLELRYSEGFVDITNDPVRQKELGIEPDYSDWWTQNET